jgi:hypothetical protein
MTVSPMNDLLIGAFWRAIKTRLDSDTMRAICNPTGTSPSEPCVYVAGLDDYSAEEGTRDEDWGRVVVVPVETLWETPDVEGWTSKIAFLVRVEFNRYATVGYQPDVGLELAQAEAYGLLQRWIPQGLSRVLVAFPVYRGRRPQPIPQVDDERDLLFTSSEFRTELAGSGA